MEIQRCIDEKKHFYDVLLNFIVDEEYDKAKFDKLCKLLVEQHIQKNKTEFIHFLKTVLCIADNHHRQPSFFNNIEQILIYIKDELKQTLSNDEIYIFFQSNKQIVLILFKEKIIIPTINIWYQINTLTQPYLSLFSDFYIPELGQFMEKGENNKIEKWTDYDKKRLVGENDSYICELIRNDSAIEFISYVNRSKISL